MMKYCREIWALIAVCLWGGFFPKGVLGQEPGQDELKKGVVKIMVSKANGVQDTGAGILLQTNDHEELYILTVYHVIKEFKDITVEFYDSPTSRITANRFPHFNKERDLAVIHINRSKLSSKITNNLKFLTIGQSVSIKAGSKVRAIGHPSFDDWVISSGEIRNFDPGSHEILFGGDAVDRGNSGGALLNANNELIGIVIEKQGRNGYATEINHAIAILKKWRISFPRLPWYHIFSKIPKKWLWAGAGAAVAGTAVAIIITRDDEPPSLPKPPGFPGN